jgi:hypothetical protein
LLLISPVSQHRTLSTFDLLSMLLLHFYSMPLAVQQPVLENPLHVGIAISSYKTQAVKGNVRFIQY